ncbi:MAG TPA: hypothetical protein VI959_00925, partial [Alphaproteobacteria bacterium]|nr:hypothetical protein [Alphaproteobacteria bacterium]
TRFHEGLLFFAPVFVYGFLKVIFCWIDHRFLKLENSFDSFEKQHKKWLKKTHKISPSELKEYWLVTRKKGFLTYSPLLGGVLFYLAFGLTFPDTIFGIQKTVIAGHIFLYSLLSVPLVGLFLKFHYRDVKEPYYENNNTRCPDLSYANPYIPGSNAWYTSPFSPLNNWPRH